MCGTAYCLHSCSWPLASCVDHVLLWHGSFHPTSPYQGAAAVIPRLGSAGGAQFVPGGLESCGPRRASPLLPGSSAAAQPGPAARVACGHSSKLALVSKEGARGLPGQQVHFPRLPLPRVTSLSWGVMRICEEPGLCHLLCGTAEKEPSQALFKVFTPPRVFSRLLLRPEGCPSRFRPAWLSLVSLGAGGIMRVAGGQAASFLGKLRGLLEVGYGEQASGPAVQQHGGDCS